MFSKLILLLCLPALLLLGEDARYSVGEVPEWVKVYECPVEEVAVKPSQVNVQYLLNDSQKNWETKTAYCHVAVKALTQNGIEEISQVQIDFNPAYYQIVVHAMRVLRDGKWSDRLEGAKHKVLQREKALEQNLYHGDLTLVYFLEDVRQGDVVEYAFSIVGEHPLYGSHYMGILSFQDEASMERIIYRFLAPPSLTFAIKHVNTDIQPQVTDLSPRVREWLWEAEKTPAYVYEARQPMWHHPMAHVQVSQFTGWEEIVEKDYPLYRLPPDFFETVPADMQGLVEEWKASTEDERVRALLALRFVQDKIRYLGIEEGMGALEPRPPGLTFQRRFGDCKDKTFLLHSLLAMMDIPSTPVLVHTSWGGRLKEMLPLPFVFNHVVLQIDIDGELYFLDPTMSLQGGSLENNCFPSYAWGLLLARGTDTLTPLPQLVAKKPTEIETSIILESQDVASLKIKTVLYDSKADNMRWQLAQEGLKTLSEDSLTEIQKVYGAALLDLPMEILDDRENNICTCFESYRLPTQKVAGKKVLEVFSYILSDYLYTNMSPLRKSPCSIAYPRWVKESIHIEDPLLQWNSFEEHYVQEHPSLLYKLSTRVGGHHAHFDVELKHLQDHIPQASLQDYWNIVKDISWKALPRITVGVSHEASVAHDDN